MEFLKERGGKWAKGADLKEGTRAKIIDEATKSESRFKDAEGNVTMQTVCKVKFEGVQDSMNVNLNRATVYGLIDAFGTNSLGWMNKVLTVHKEITAVAGRRVTALYLVPEGFEVSTDDNGYIVIVRAGEKPTEPIEAISEVTEDDVPF